MSKLHVFDIAIFMYKVRSNIANLIAFSKSSYAKPEINLIKSKYRISFWVAFLRNTFLGATENFFVSFPLLS